MIIFGTRPEAIKLAPVILEIARRQKMVPVVVVTAQHREMLDQVLDCFHIKPEIDLNLMTPDQSLFQLSARAIERFGEVLKSVRPDCVLTQGDTTTTFFGSLAAYYEKIPVGHVEAGLRTGDKYAPFPEEMNRKMVSVLADYHFAPTETNRRILTGEGVPDDRILITGNTVIDALLMTVDRDFHHKELERYGDQRMVLITAHRRESFGKPLENVLEAIRELSVRHPECRFVYPNVRIPAQKILGSLENVTLLEPLEYRTFVNFMAKSYLILTDSGGVQEEAPSLGKPVLVLRDVTERPEAIEAGTVRIVGTSKEKIIMETENLLNNKEAYDRMARAHNPYGDGKASKRIADFLEEHLSE